MFQATQAAGFKFLLEISRGLRFRQGDLGLLGDD